MEGAADAVANGTCLLPRASNRNEGVQPVPIQCN